MTVHRQNPDGTWTPAQPLPMTGWKAHAEAWCRRRGMSRLADRLAAWDERGLGR